MTDTGRLAALLHELGSGCMLPLDLSRHLCEPTDPRYDDLHPAMARRLVAAGVTFGRKWGVGVDAVNGEMVTVVCERLADGEYRIVRPSEADCPHWTTVTATEGSEHPGHVCFDFARYDGLRDWWDGLDDDEKREAYLVEKGNADALASTTHDALDVDRLARALLTSAPNPQKHPVGPDDVSAMRGRAAAIARDYDAR
jgi:hypothetical protein